MHHLPVTPEQILYMTMGLCGIVLVVWLKWQDERSGGLEKSPNWIMLMVPVLVLLTAQLQLIAQIVMNRMGS
ncbi:MAG: hypothetical protein OHK0047_37350 [Leptolyngbyaceae cyanobacterium]|uniref:hypothetical protein n=1 Tax=Leptodesmis sichuanensis TaxID=2906798 RepID=UPI001F26730B|nr:hypothetical protein [Leptodesmis sichuanensis]UIE39470.1 hypothetical protein KIK02_07885 [Leptodesmis sichuanensis A121]